MWLKEVLEVVATGTSRGYDIAPAAFWLVRVFDLGFSIPLGLISVYLLWARPNKAYPVICLFYGFFFTQIVAVLAMGVTMFLTKDPTFLWRDLVVFTVLAAVIAFGFFYVRRNYRIGCPQGPNSSLRFVRIFPPRIPASCGHERSALISGVSVIVKRTKGSYRKSKGDLTYNV